MGKIIKLHEVRGLIKPYKATLVGGVFDIFHVGHLRYLRAASKRGRPLIVIVQTDKAITIRKGLGRPIINQQQRAEIISALECVDYVLVLSKAPHFDGYLEIIKPKHLIFFNENLLYRKRRAKEVKKKFPFIKMVFIKSREVGRKVMSTTRIAKKILDKPRYKKIKNPIAKELHRLAENSKAKVGKISALFLYKGKIILKTENNKSERHAENILIRRAKRKRLSLVNYNLYILIPPCIMCAELILKNNIKKVYYLYSYGNNDGIRFLRNNGVIVKKFR